jgi:type IV secretion system protein VirD4
VASTCAAIGILLVTIWQSRAQIDASYGSLADSVLTNHGTKILFSGASDLATLNYASDLVGTEEILESTRQHDSNGRTVAHTGIARLPLLPPDLLRRTKPGDALLIHGTLRPAHLKARPYSLP